MLTEKLYAVCELNSHFVHFIPYSASSSRKDDVILDVSVVSATFKTTIPEAEYIQRFCEQKYPNKTFYVHTFYY